MGPRAGLDRCGKSLPHRDSIPGTSSPYPVAITTELPGPQERERERERDKNVKCPLVQALRLCTSRTAHRGSRAIALHFHDYGTRRG